MLHSTVTQKGQTTIPKEIRDLLNLRPKDKVYYLIEDNRVILKPIHGDVLDLQGCLPLHVHSENFEKIRNITKKRVADKIIERS